MPDYDPDPIPNIVIHPGDTVALGDDADTIRLLDRHGVHYATLDCERDVAGHGWIIHAIRFVSAPGERGVLPVRAYPHTEAHPQPHTESNSLNVSVTPYTYIGDPPLALTATTTAVAIPVTISHYHEHSHTHPDDPFRFAYRHSHSHDHTGSGGDIWLSEHVTNVHDHDHADDATHPVDSPEQYPDAWTEDA